MEISSIISYIQLHWQEGIELYLKVVGLASIIVKLTPTLKDDDVLKGIIRFVGKYVALNKKVTPNA